MTDDADWKQVGDIYETSGVILEPGSFIAKSGHQVSITNNDSDDFYTSIEKNLPITIDHSNVPVGYAIKFAKNMDNTISHKGIVIDQAEFRNKVILGGYNHISPDIEYIRDPRGNIVSKKLVAISFVKNPAMTNTTAEVSRFAFSAPEIEVKSMPEENITNTTTQNTPPTTAPFDVNALAEAITNGMSAKIDERINALQSQLDAMRLASNPPQKSAAQEFLEQQGNPTKTNVTETTDTTSTTNSDGTLTTLVSGTIAPPVDKDVFEEYSKMKAEIEKRDAELAKYREQNEKVLKKQLSDITAELKNLGYNDPSGLVKSLKTYEEKIETLNAIKVNHVKTTPMNSTTQSQMSADGGGSNNDKLTIRGVTEPVGLKIDPKYQEHLSKKFGIPFQ